MTLRINVNGHTARNDCVENVVHWADYHIIL